MREEFFIERGGKRYALFAGLLDEAHTRGLVGIDTELLQIPEEANGNRAIVKATVQIEEEANGSDPGRIRTFSGTGDASPDNVGQAIQPHLLRMAETRAKARALRDAVNIGAMALEEVSDTDDEGKAEGSGRSGGTGGSTGEEGSGSTGSGKGSRDRRAGAEAQPRGLQRSRRNQDSSSDTPASRPEDQADAATESQISSLKELAVEWRGEDGVQRLESRIKKPLASLSRDEAQKWIERLTPDDTTDAQTQAQ